MKKLFTFFLSFLMISGLWAQNQKSLDQAQSFVEQNLEDLGLSADDIADYILTDMYISDNGVTHIYLTQTVDGIPIHNAILNLNIMADGTVPFYGNRFVANLNEKVSSRNFSTAPTAAISAVEKVLEVQNTNLLQIKTQKSDDHMIYHPTSYAERDIEVKKSYALTADGTVAPTWDVTVKMKDNADWWSIRVDANTSEVISKHNYTVYCNHSKGKYSKNHADTCSDHNQDATTSQSALTSAMKMGASYRVYGLPAESPIHGPHEIVTGAEIDAASPFGWHDVDGIEGPEYTITRGNNVHAYTDKNDTGISAGDEPDGGDDLIFDFSHDLLAEPVDNELSGVTNLFYMNNIIHDITHLLGFNEAAGNFQRNTYGNSGIGNDAVLAQASDGSGTNNANFATPPDGAPGEMQMYLWDINRNSLVNVDEPTELTGSYEYGAVGDGWSYANYENFDIRANIAIAFDDSPSGGTECCNDIVNDSDVNNNIALIDRGGCEFGSKAFNAQNNGAVACIICNVAGINGGDGETAPGMLGGVDGPQVTIPTFMMKKSDCDRIRASINSGIDVVMSVRPEITIGPSQLDAAYDNGIIAHEYAHGISNRLTGGPSAAGCLGNGEQMGEGWSDYFSLVLTVEDGDTGADSRGIGTFAQGETVNGRGIRRFPYSTDMNINPQTYDDIKGQAAPHPIGEVWVDCLWDMFWLMTDLYGYDADWSNIESGNHKAVKLVIDGMKLQPCSPGFIDGRDAILAADQINYGGENACIIWEAFARRGVGVSANQNSSDDANDGSENFDILATCIAKLKIDKSVTELINPGDDIEVNLLVRNHTPEDISSVVVTDLLPDGTSLVAGSASMDIASMTGNEIVFDLSSMASLDEVTITYTVSTPSSDASISLFKDEFEEGIDNWSQDINGFNNWNLSSAQALSGNFSYNIPDVDMESDVRLVSVPLSVTGANPVLRFWHKWETESGGDGGFVEISEDGSVWRPVNDKFIRNGYTSIINYGTLAIPNNQAFTGNNFEIWRDSWIDLSDFTGESTQFRFRFATDDMPQGALPGWFVDDVEIMDLFKYSSTACVSGGEGGDACTEAVETFVNTANSVSVKDDVFAANVNMEIYPNPAQDYASIRLASKEDIHAVLTVTTISGQNVFSNVLTLNRSEQILTVNTSNFPKGFYIVKLESGNAVVSKKLVVN